jgi:hypothetical protein
LAFPPDNGVVTGASLSLLADDEDSFRDFCLGTVSFDSGRWSLLISEWCFESGSRLPYLSLLGIYLPRSLALALFTFGGHCQEVWKSLNSSSLARLPFVLLFSDLFLTEDLLADSPFKFCFRSGK